MPAEIQITEEIKSQLGCDGITLESGFLMAGPQRMCVLVARVNLRQGFLANPLPKKVVKFSERRFAIPQCDKLKLSTARCYREHEDSESGIRDELEARQKRDIRTVLAEAGSAALVSSIPSLSGEMTYGTDGFWIYCTSMMPQSGLELEQMRQRFSAECTTAITGPSVFARHLGRMFAEHSTEGDLHLDCPAHVEQWAAMLSGIGGGIVRVYHGPVLYEDNAEEAVFSRPQHFQGIAATFVKRRCYEWQNEYRFTVSTIGTPATDELCLPISDEMRGLAEIEPTWLEHL